MNKSKNIYSSLSYLIDETITPYKKLSDTLIVKFRNYTATVRQISQCPCRIPCFTNKCCRLVGRIPGNIIRNFFEISPS